MHQLLSKLLTKRKITKDELTNEERIDFDRWENVLSKGEITLEKIKQFCEQQIKIIEMRWKNLDNAIQKNEKLIIMHNVYSSMIKAMNSNEMERATVEKYLLELIDAQKT